MTSEAADLASSIERDSTKDINTDRRSGIDFFLTPVVKYLDEGMKVR